MNQINKGCKSNMVKQIRVNQGIHRFLRNVLALILLYGICMPVTVFAGLGDLQIEEIGKDHYAFEAENFFEVSGESGNGHYLGKAILVDENGIAYLLLSLGKNSTVKNLDEGIKVNGQLIPAEQVNWDKRVGKNTVSLTVQLPNQETKTIDTNYGFMLFQIGEISTIVPKFTVAVDTDTGTHWDGIAWDMGTTEFEIKMDYGISKTVDKEKITIGDYVKYSITVSNHSDISLSDFHVIDILPAGLQVTGVQIGQGMIEKPQYTSNGALILEEKVSLPKEGIKTYYIYGYITEDVTPGTLTNTASMRGNSVPEKHDDATITVEAAKLTVQKKLGGDMYLESDTFPFSVEINKPAKDGVNQAYTHSDRITLGNNEQKTYSNLPIGATITVKELDAKGYKVSVNVNGEPAELTDKDSKEYTITIDKEDKDITIEFVNSKEAVPDTGILLESAPYLIILALAIAGAVAFIFYKRKSKNN